MSYTIPSDFIERSTKLETLGEGTFGSVSLYDTPLGRCVVKETKLSHRSLGYPPDFLNEVDTLMKLRPLKTVVTIKAVVYDEHQRKGFLCMEALDCNLSEWSRRNPFHRRIEYLGNIIEMIGSTLAMMHYFSLIHNDMKTNNILVQETSTGPFFKLADFGKSRFLTDSDAAYGAIEKYRPPASTSVYHSEYWAFMVSLTEVILGGHRMVNMESVDEFYEKYSKRSGRFDLKRYLKNNLTSEEFAAIPRDFWKFVEPVLRSRRARVVGGLSDISVHLNMNTVHEIDACISREGSIDGQFFTIRNEFKQRFAEVGASDEFPRFTRVFNKFLSSIDQPVKKLYLKRYAEVAFVTVAPKKVTELNYFDDMHEFLLYHRAFLTSIGYQINVL